MEECLVEMGTGAEPALSVCGGGVCASNLGFVLHPDMGLPLVKIAALKQDTQESRVPVTTISALC